MTLADAVDALQASQPFVYGLVALATVVRWLRYRDRASGLASLLFLVLASAIVLGTVVGADPGLRTQQVIVAALVSFPYLLFRFGAAFRRPGPALEVAAGSISAVAVLGIFLFREIPEAGAPTTTAFTLYTALVLVQWVGLSAIVAWWFWNGGRGRPAVVRWRMRTLAAGVLLLASALLLAGLFPDEGEQRWVALGVNLLAVAAAPLFVAGLAPPRVFLDRWRRADEDELWRVESQLVGGGSREEVAGALLPYVVRVLGARAAVLGDVAGRVVAAHGLDDASAQALLDGSDLGARDAAVWTDLPSGRLVVVGDRYTPYFGRDEVETVARLGRLTDVALRRAEAAAAEQRASEELRRSNATIRDFVAAASHDLRTPIAVIKGFAATLTTAWEQVPEEEKLKHLATIERQANHLARIVADLLTVSQLDSGAVEPDLVALDLGVVVREVVADLEHGHGDVEVVADGRLLAWADAEHARRITRNLLENALRYGEPPVTVTLATASPWVELRVRDHGGGVPESFVPRLFERFARADKGASTAKQGTGLGLSIVRGLARAGGGDAWYEAAEPGACFVVRFPTAGETGT